MDIRRVPVLSDNYIFLLHDPARGEAAVVDPAESEPVLAELKVLGATLVAIFNTHHHHDHIGGNRALKQAFPDLCIYGGAGDRGRIPGQDVFLQEGDRLQFGDRPAQVFDVPGHTRAHIAYYFPPTTPDQPGELFCGDTIFSGGCGRLFEGTPAQMVTSLGKLRHLPDHTRVWCAHEYTVRNLTFTLTIVPPSPELQQRYQEVESLRQAGKATIPTWLGMEKQTNLFLQWDDPTLQAAMNTTDPIQAFGRLRDKRDQF
ncbi:hydroxyacylglutathione hydrolase [Spirulina sp. CCNP1310]|uniref:hydroxyacylglutathione hydrolase n=1 Tax=Spirulina sp. CCNP1310 TaxID=3110249 RepID=UPI002B2142BF|nr:hydroxyacylglutathione hydrolase [Spirulina sp. CCNP1310]MEA5418939.1 hydroxyacylglutathione hydrolase [Spirulina sp. CCNP1310]